MTVTMEIDNTTGITTHPYKISISNFAGAAVLTPVKGFPRLDLFYWLAIPVPEPYQAGYDHIHVNGYGFRVNGFDARMPLGSE